MSKDIKVKELPAILTHFIPNFMSFMLVIPVTDNRQSMNLTKMVKTTLGALANLCKVSVPAEQMSLSLLYVTAIQLLSTACTRQTMYPYHISKYLVHFYIMVPMPTMYDFHNSTDIFGQIL